MPKIVILWTDAAFFLLVLMALFYAWRASRHSGSRQNWRKVLQDRTAMCAAVVLALFVLVALLDSMHYRPRLPPAPGQPATAAPAYAPQVRSVLDALLDTTLLAKSEKSYSVPLATHLFTKETMLAADGTAYRDFPRLIYAGVHLDDPEADWHGDVTGRLLKGALAGVVAALLAGAAVGSLVARRQGWQSLLSGRSAVPWRAMWLTFLVVCLVVGVLASLAGGYHVFGTDRTGNDVLWQALKSIRTALVIGTLTTLAMLPPALIFGISAGYFKGWVDDLIQYIYTTLTSIPGVLLIAACVLMMQVYIDTHPEMFPTSAARADLRLFLLCLILGLTGWAGLCRLLRAEVLKLRELEYIQAARAFGVSHLRIMLRHLLPNVMHIVLITMVLEFSGLVLYEAVLSYLGIGVDPGMNSFGSMIDMARLEMSRDPMVWWNLTTAFFFMLVLVLAANLFADAVREAFDPHGRRYRVRRRLSRHVAGNQPALSGTAGGERNT
ncbi:ABC transporter permease [Alcaligenaceae bacterium SJ-26]|nr:ABC transporter permease [Alcaligenaceae bacterium SJ-26]